MRWRKRLCYGPNLSLTEVNSLRRFSTWRSVANYSVNYTIAYARIQKFITRRSPLRYFFLLRRTARNYVLNGRVNYTNAQLRIRRIFIAARPRLLTIFRGAMCKSIHVDIDRHQPSLRAVYRAANLLTAKARCSKCLCLLCPLCPYRL